MTDEVKKEEWVLVSTNTYRLKVPGGWVYRYGFYDNGAMVFVSDPNHDKLLNE